MIDPRSFLFITLDSCRFDTFAAAEAENLKGLGPLHRAMAPGYFTYASHAAMFVGFTPGIAGAEDPYINPKYCKVFKMDGGGSAGMAKPFVKLRGRNIVEGFNRLGHLTIGTGSVAWFNPDTATGRTLVADFQRYFYAGNTYSLPTQLAWIDEQLRDAAGQPVFLFINVGETHVPYYFDGADWPVDDSPCVPFGTANDVEECRRRQRACLEFVDRQLADLLRRFERANTFVCADHGDAWGEDGLWEHGIHHPIVLEVPLLFRLNCAPVSTGSAR